MKKISICNAHLHNLKNVNVDLPVGKFIVITGVSGSGKSTLAFDIVFEAGRRSYLQALGVVSSLGEEHGYDQITGLMPTVAVKQGIVRRSNPRSVVGTKTRLLNYLATLYADHHNRLAGSEKIMPSQFSFNSPMGMCLSCQGRGVRFELDMSVLLPSPDTTLQQVYQHALIATTFNKRIQRLQEKLQIDPLAPFQSLPEGVQKLVFFGVPYEGIRQVSLYEALRYKLVNGRPVNGALKATVCSDCSGFRLSNEACLVMINGKHLGQLGQMPIAELDKHLMKTASRISSKKKSGSVQRLLIDKALSVTSQLISVKLDYLTPYRPVPSLSGGEMQRLFLMSHLRAEVSPLLYVFDEPTSGLHELEKQQLIENLAMLSKNGNTVVVVEHDQQTLQAADYVVDMGPLAGIQGGEVMYQGKVNGLKRCRGSLTGQYLTGDPTVGKCEARVVSKSTPILTLTGAKTNNLKNVTVRLPLGMLVGVAGLSGSGKSSLIADTLVPAISQSLNSETDTNDERRVENPPEGGEGEALNLSRSTPVFGQLIGVEQLDHCIEVSQEPIGRRANSNVVTYLGVWDRIRKCFANTQRAIDAGLTAGHFSFNAAGACQQCNGNGQNHLWLGGSLVSYPCDQCEGKRYEADILRVSYKGYSISDVLAASVSDAIELFADNATVKRMLSVVASTGMDYITLGQPTNTLSGGEAQRIKLARELGRQRRRKRCLYILDEPTTGLSLYDTGKLMSLLQELIDSGNSVIVIEHDPVVLSQCDWLLELGPGGGNRGGSVVASGAPVKIRQSKKSLIGPCLLL